jgi:predicted nuclease of predicted toxin-antitoxin system
LLVAQGHDVVTTADLGLDGQPDLTILESAVREDRVLLTKNCLDFLDLHRKFPNHKGILLVFQEPEKLMSYETIVRAISNVESAGILLENTCQTLNSWQFIRS